MMVRRSKRKKPSRQALIRAFKAPRGPEIRYVQALRGIVRGWQEETLREAKSRWERTRKDVSDSVRAMRVAPLAARMARTVNEQTITGARKFLGDAVDGVDVTGLILRAVAENVNLVEKAQRAYSEDVHEIFSNPDNWGLRWEDLQAKLVERGNVAASHAKLIAKDQTLKFHAAITEARMKAAGFSGYEWSTSKDERVRPDHVALEGSKQTWDNPPVTNKKTGDRNHPGEDYQCRCVAVPDFDTLSEEQVAIGETSAEQANQFTARLARPAPPPAPVAIRRVVVASVPRTPLAKAVALAQAQGVSRSEFLREGMRDLSQHRGAYEGATPSEIDLIATGQMPAKNSGKVLPPITLVVEGTQMTLRDGRHRYQAAREAGARRILANVITYTAKGRKVEKLAIVPLDGL